MPWPPKPLRKIAALMGRSALDRQMSEEMSFHLEMQAAAHVEAGMTEREARFAAQRDFGHLEGIKELARDQRGMRWMEDVERDLRYGARQLLKSPGFAAVAICSLAVGIGVCTALFSAARGILWRPIAAGVRDTLVFVDATPPVSVEKANSATPVWPDWDRISASFVDIAAFRGAVHATNDAGAPSRVWSTEVTPNFFDVLGAEPLLGRTFHTSDVSPLAPTVAVLSHAFWMRECSGRPDVVDSSLRLDHQLVTIVGVMPRNFQPRGKDRPVIYTPKVFPELPAGEYRTRDLSLVGRVRAGVTLKTATADLSSLLNRTLPMARDGVTPWRIRLTPMLEATVGEVRPTLLMLLGMAGLLLLMAQVNIANLLYLRAGARRKEIALRVALGASSGRVLRQVLSESVLMVGIGGVLGTLLAYGILKILLRVAPEMPRVSEVSIDGAALAFAMVLTALSVVVCSVASALRSSRVQVNESLKAEGTGLSEEPRRLRNRNLFVVAEVALALMLLVASGLLARSFLRLSEVNPGFDPSNVYRNRLTLASDRYPTFRDRSDLVARLEEGVSNTPGVESVAVTTSLPFDGRPRSAEVARRTKNRPWNAFVERAAITPRYFDVLKIPLLRGRAFSNADDAGAPRVAIVSENLAQTYFPGVDAIGKRIADTNGPSSSLEIVGVVGNVKQAGLHLRSLPQLYVPYAQNVDNAIGTHLVFRSAVPMDGVRSALANLFHDLDRELPFDSPWPIADSISSSLEIQRFATILFGIFSVAAVCLAVVGIYGVVYYSASERVFEIGIRRALGAQAHDILRLVISTGGRPIAIGLLAGIVGALAMSHVLRFALFEISAHDPLTFVIAVSLLAIVALLACWLPAREASKIAPHVTLRHP